MNKDNTTDFKSLKEFLNELNLAVSGLNRGVKIQGEYNGVTLSPEELMRLSYDLTALALGERP